MLSGSSMQSSAVSLAPSSPSILSELSVSNQAITSNVVSQTGTVQFTSLPLIAPTRASQSSSEPESPQYDSRGTLQPSSSALLPISSSHGSPNASPSLGPGPGPGPDQDAAPHAKGRSRNLVPIVVAIGGAIIFIAIFVLCCIRQRRRQGRRQKQNSMPSSPLHAPSPTPSRRTWQNPSDNGSILPRAWEKTSAPLAAAAGPSLHGVITTNCRCIGAGSSNDELLAHEPSSKEQQEVKDELHTSTEQLPPAPEELGSHQIPRRVYSMRLYVRRVQSRRAI